MTLSTVAVVVMTLSTVGLGGGEVWRYSLGVTLLLMGR